MSYLCVSHPAAWLDLVTVQPPVLQLLLEQGATHVRRVVQLTSSEKKHGTMDALIKVRQVARQHTRLSLVNTNYFSLVNTN